MSHAFTDLMCDDLFLSPGFYCLQTCLGQGVHYMADGQVKRIIWDTVCIAWDKVYTLPGQVIRITSDKVCIAWPGNVHITCM